MPQRVFLDANVLFSASQPNSAFARLIAAARAHATIVTSDLASIEARRNVALERPEWSADLEDLLERIELVPSVLFDLPVPMAEKDAPLLCAAIRARCHYFVTGDQRDFGRLYGQAFDGVVVIRPRQLAELLVEWRRTTEEESLPE